MREMIPCPRSRDVDPATEQEKDIQTNKRARFREEGEAENSTWAQPKNERQRIPLGSFSLPYGG